MRVSFAAAPMITAPRFGQESRTARWAVSQLLDEMGSADLLGEPPILPRHQSRIIAILSAIPSGERDVLLGKAQRLELSDPDRSVRILPRNFERRVAELIRMQQ